ncbi:MAG TPA: FliH/SctL family protein [Labilithrix sp.]|nr:FliH/SctL family protein [Labilithrix sp.]
MSLGRARVVKAAAGAAPPGAAEAQARHALARRVPAAVVGARAEADRITEAARQAASAIVAEAHASVAGRLTAAVREVREQELARIAAEHLALRVGEEQRAERDLDRTLEIAALLAERMIGEAIALEPSRIAALASGALLETRGARRVRIEASPEDLPALQTMLAGLGEGIATLEASAELGRGSLVVHTELGRIDARLGPQLGRLAESLREALRSNQGSQGSSRE